MPVVVTGGGEAADAADRPIYQRINRNNSSALRRSLSAGFALIIVIAAAGTAARPLRHCRVAGETDMRRFIWAALLCVLASQSSIAQQRSVAGLDRPDPGIGEGFAAALADQFKTAFGLHAAEARCLVYEVMTDLRATGKYDSKPVDIARKVASRCALVLKAPR